MDKVLILGGTGVMGKFLVENLSKAYRVDVTTRGRKNNTENVTYYQGNAHDKSFIENLLQGRHYKAIVDFMNYGTQEYVNRYGLLLNHTEQLVYVSSARVYADSKSPITENNSRLLDISEDEKFLKSDDYALAKARQENLLRNSGMKNWTIIRPYMTYSEKKLDLGFYSKELWLYRVLKGKSIIFTEDVAKSFTTLTYGEDVANGISVLVGNDNAKGRTFHITTDETLKWNDIILIYKELLLAKGYKLNVIMQPKSELSSENIYRYDRCYNRKFDNSNIKEFVDLSSFVSIKDGIKKSLDSFLENPQWGIIDWKKQAYWDSITKDRMVLSDIPTIKDKALYLCFRYCISYPLVYNLTHRI